MAGKAARFISDSAAAHTPFALELATFAPHGLYPPRLPSAAPPWLASRTPLTDKEKQAVDKDFRKRAQAVQSVDRMIGTVPEALDKAGVRGNTELVFTSDNGYHMGEHRLTPGKQTAFDTDVHVPLLTGTASPAWRTVGLVEHHGPDFDRTDPDKPKKNSGSPSTCEAIRGPTFTYVEYTRRHPGVLRPRDRSPGTAQHRRSAAAGQGEAAARHPAGAGLLPRRGRVPVLIRRTAA